MSMRVKTRQDEDRTVDDGDQNGIGVSEEVTQVMQLDAEVTQATEPTVALVDAYNTGRKKGE